MDNFEIFQIFVDHDFKQKLIYHNFNSDDST